MPALVPLVTIYLNKLLQDGAAATCAFCRKTCRVVEVAINVPVVLIVGVLWAKKGRA
jgi:hypothetical protein